MDFCQTLETLPMSASVMRSTHNAYRLAAVCAASSSLCREVERSDLYNSSRAPLSWPAIPINHAPSKWITTPYLVYTTSRARLFSHVIYKVAPSQRKGIPRCRPGVRTLLSVSLVCLCQVLVGALAAWGQALGVCASCLVKLRLFKRVCLLVQVSGCSCC